MYKFEQDIHNLLPKLNERPIMASEGLLQSEKGESIVDSVLSKLEDGDSRTVCRECEQAEATLECLDCNEKYCAGCFSAVHSQGPMQRHQASQITGPARASNAARFCEAHEGEMLSFWCKKCHVLTCALCLLFGSHQNHKSTYLDAAVNEAQISVREKAQSIAQLYQQIEFSLEEFEHLRHQVHQEFVFKQNEIKNKVDTLRGILDRKQAELLGAVRETLGEKRLAVIDKNIFELRRKLQAVRESTVSAQRILHRGQDSVSVLEESGRFEFLSASLLGSKLEVDHPHDIPMARMPGLDISYQTQSLERLEFIKADGMDVSLIKAFNGLKTVQTSPAKGQLPLTPPARSRSASPDSLDMPMPPLSPMSSLQGLGLSSPPIPSRPPLGPRELGHVKHVVGTYGFIKRDNVEGDLFYHTSQVEGQVILRKGDRVEFTIIQNMQTGKLNAIDIRLICPAPAGEGDDLGPDAPTPTLIPSAHSDVPIIWESEGSREDPYLVATLTGHSNWVNALVVLKKTLFSGCSDYTIKTWDLERYECTNTLTGHNGFVNTLVISSDSLLFSGSGDKTIKAWNIDNQQCIETVEGHTSLVNALAVDGENLYSGSSDRLVKVWDLATLQCTMTLTGHMDYVTTLALSEGRLFSGSADKKIKVWDVKSGSCVHTFDAHKDWVNALLVSGDRLYSGSSDNIIKVWDIRTVQRVGKMTGHTSWVNALTIAGKRLFSGSGDSSIKVWDVDSFKCVGTLNGHKGYVKSLTVADRRLFSGGAGDRCIKIWRGLFSR